jgi:hypothetical protein
MRSWQGEKSGTPGVCTPLVLHLCCAVLRLYSTCAALYSTCTPLYSASLVEAYELGSTEKFRKSMKLGSNIQGRKNFGFFQWETVRSRRRNPKIFRLGILFPIPIDFCEFSAGHGDFSWSFRPVPIVLGDRNPRPGLYSACTPLYFTRTPLVLRCTLLVLRLYSTRTPLVVRCTSLVLRCTLLVLRFYSTRTPEYWSLAFSPLGWEQL